MPTIHGRKQIVWRCENRLSLIHIFLVKSASRMARNTVDLLTLVRELKSIGVTVQFEKEQFDTDSATAVSYTHLDVYKRQVLNI